MTNEENQSNPDNHDNMESLIKELNENNKQILKLTKKIHNFVIWQKVFGVIKILIILTPLILAWIYVPRWLDTIGSDPGSLLDNPWLENYINAIDDSVADKINSGEINLQNIDPEKVPEKYRELLR